MSEKQIICCFCNEPIPPLQDEDGNNVYWEGNNAKPLKDGRCCDPCNIKYVINTRDVIINATAESDMEDMGGGLKSMDWDKLTSKDNSKN